MCFYSKLRSFILLQDLIQKYEGDLSQLSKRCEEMKKLYSNVLVHIIFKCNENKPTFLFKKEEGSGKEYKKFPLDSYLHRLKWKENPILTVRDLKERNRNEVITSVTGKIPGLGHDFKCGGGGLFLVFLTLTIMEIFNFSLLLNFH